MRVEPIAENGVAVPEQVVWCDGGGEGGGTTSDEINTILRRKERKRKGEMNEMP